MKPLASPQVETAHYFRGYDHMGRFASYWHQIHETVRIGGRILEIGVGNKTVATLLRNRGCDVTTVDIDEALGPDVVADVRNLPFEDGSFDTVLAAEVLEHLPWAEVPHAVSQIARVITRGAVISVPDADVAFTILADVPNALQIARLAVRQKIPFRHALWTFTLRASWRRAGGRVGLVASLPPLRPERAPSCEEHHWELGLAGVTRADFVRILAGNSLHAVRDFRVPENPYHHFFITEIGAK